MKSFRNLNARSAQEAAAMMAQNPNSMVVGGGSDLLGMIKERIVTPDVLVNFKPQPELSGIMAKIRVGPTLPSSIAELSLGGFVTLDAISHDPSIRTNFRVLAEAAGQVGTPQIRNAGTLAGNLMQRPWCWYYRNNFPCYKNGGNQCFSVVGENEFHAIFGGGPSYIVHPSDTAVALVALDARFRIVGNAAERQVNAGDFFTLPTLNPARENSLLANEVLAEVILPGPKSGTRSTYTKILDREAWTHAVISVAAVLEMDGDVCRSARVVLGGVAPIPWRLPEVEKMLTGQKITEELAARAGEKAVEGARPLAKNGYKVPLTRSVVKQTLLSLGATA
ncbi:MAG: FAD binding domain-containing protein [Acidobacteriota bacterium]